ncbi:MAG: sugar transferase [Paracoccaceae bacterium]
MSTIAAPKEDQSVLDVSRTESTIPTIRSIPKTEASRVQVQGPRNFAWKLRTAGDRVVALALVIMALPLLLTIAAMVRLDSRGPVIFRQPRFGRNAQPFDCLKFRTMRTDMTDVSGGRQTANDDPRVTRVGYFLRRSSLDELPQLLNVLRGEMALIGPRAHPCGMRVAGQLCEDLVPNYHNRHAILPGITGLAQVSGSRGAVKDIEALEDRVALDCAYIALWSPALDFKIVMRTVKTVLSTKQAF